MNNIEVKQIDTKEGLNWSVMIPTFNCADFLKKTLTSVINQGLSSEEMEIWVVDDYSTKDNPELVVSEIGKGRVNFFRQKENVGQLKNFETCLNMSKGKIIHLLHGDDMVYDNFYKKLEMPLLADDSIGAAFTRHNHIDELDNVIYTSDELIPKPGIYQNFLWLIAQKQVIQTPSIVVKREVYEKLGGFNKTLSWCEDWEMWVRIACNYNFYYEPEILAAYRVHKNSNSGDSIITGRFIDDSYNCIKTYTNILPFSDIKKKQVALAAKKHIFNYAKGIINVVIDKRDNKTSFILLKKSLKMVVDTKSFFYVFKSLFKVLVRYRYNN